LTIWNRYQEKIFEYGINETGNGVVMARAGTGKSATIRELASRLPANTRNLVCAFNSKIRDEMQQKMQLSNVSVQTMHQMGYAALNRQAGHRLEIDKYKIRDLVQGVMGYDNKALWGDTSKLLSLSMAHLLETFDDIGNLMYRHNLAPAVPNQEELMLNTVQRIMKIVRDGDQLRVSFDEQIYIPAFLNLRTGSYDNVFIDEAQDLNASQYRIALNAVKPGGRIFAFGDDKQALYGFRGADSDAMGNLIKVLKATVLPLSVTYRCPTNVVDLVKKFVPDFEAAPGAAEGLVQPKSEREFLAGVAAGDAVISRTNAALTKYAFALLAQGKRARIIGRDIGTHLEKLIQRVRHHHDIRDALNALTEYVHNESERLEAAKKEDEIDELHDNLEALRAISEGCSNLGGLRRRMGDLFSDDEVANDPRSIPCMTTHKAKGLEFDRVWMLETTFKVNSVEGENLYYVAATRAKKELYLVRVPRQDGSLAKTYTDEIRYFDKKKEEDEHE